MGVHSVEPGLCGSCWHLGIRLSPDPGTILLERGSFLVMARIVGKTSPTILKHVERLERQSLKPRTMEGVPDRFRAFVEGHAAEVQDGLCSECEEPGCRPENTLCMGMEMRALLDGVLADVG